MEQLPLARVQIDRPFNKTEVNLAGHFPVKCTGHRSVKFEKIYAAAFVCMVTKAVHLEVLSSLSTESFVATLDRFISRRDLLSIIFSDNATNIVGNKNLLKSIRCREINWQFIPP